MKRFSGGVFSSAVPTGRSGAELELTREAVIAHVDGQRFEVRYDGCELERGGASDRMIFCRTRDRSLTIYSEDKTFLEELTQVGGPRLRPQLEHMAQSHRRHLRSHHFMVYGLLAAVVALPFAGYWALRGAAVGAVSALPVSVDEAIGRTTVSSMDLGGPIVDDPVINDAIGTMVNKLAAAEPSEFKFNVRVVRAPTVNAFALPGGEIVVYMGLIESADTPDQVAGVVAHEMAHVTERHGLTRMANSIGVVAAVSLLLGDIGGLIGTAGQVLTLATINDYGQDQETEADALGTRRLYEANVSPMALAEFFQKLLDKQGDIPDALSWLGSHPQHQERIDTIVKIARKLPPTDYRPIIANWDEVRRHAMGGGAIETITGKTTGKAEHK